MTTPGFDPAQPPTPGSGAVPPPFGAPGFGPPPSAPGYGPPPAYGPPQAGSPAPPSYGSPAPSFGGGGAPEADLTVGEPGSFDRLSLVIAILLATIGVLGAFVTWRIGQLANTGDDSSRAALAARREYTAAIAQSAAELQGAWASWIGYETARKTADSLRAQENPLDALRADREASAYWYTVPSADISIDGIYDRAVHLDSLVAQNTRGKDVFALPHLDTAATAEAKSTQLGQIGFAIACILPFLTLAEVLHNRRVRLLLTFLSAAGLVAGTAVLVSAWG